MWNDVMLRMRRPSTSLSIIMYHLFNVFFESFASALVASSQIAESTWEFIHLRRRLHRKRTVGPPFCIETCSRKNFNCWRPEMVMVNIYRKNLTLVHQHDLFGFLWVQIVTGGLGRSLGTVSFLQTSENQYFSCFDKR